MQIEQRAHEVMAYGAEPGERAAVRERLPDRNVGAVGRLLELRAVEGAAAAVGPRAATIRALPHRSGRPLREQQDVDAPVGRRLQHLLPARGRTLAASVGLAPPLNGVVLLTRARLDEERPGDLEQLVRAGVGLGGRRADDR